MDIHKLSTGIKMIEESNNTKNLKFYSNKAIGITTFIGGPLAAGYLIRENYLSLNKPEEGKKSLLIGILSTIFLFAGIYMIPESIIDKFPRQILPAIYTGIIYLIVEKIHGAILKEHEENGNEFYSGWRAAGIGFISLIVISIGIFGYAYLYEQKDLIKYDNQISKFTKNEEVSLSFYEHLDSNTNNLLLFEIDNVGIPKWKENIEIIKELNQIENLPPELVEQNKILLKYSELRLKAFELFKEEIKDNNSFINNTYIYSKEIEQLHEEIDEQLKKLN